MFLERRTPAEGGGRYDEYLARRRQAVAQAQSIPPGAPFGEFAAAHTASPPSVHVLALSMSGSGAVGATHVGGDVSDVTLEPHGSVVDAGLPTVVYPGRHEYV